MSASKLALIGGIHHRDLFSPKRGVVIGGCPWEPCKPRFLSMSPSYMFLFYKISISMQVLGQHCIINKLYHTNQLYFSSWRTSTIHPQLFKNLWWIQQLKCNNHSSNSYHSLYHSATLTDLGATSLGHRSRLRPYIKMHHSFFQYFAVPPIV